MLGGLGPASRVSERERGFRALYAPPSIIGWRLLVDVTQHTPLLLLLPSSSFHIQLLTLLQRTPSSTEKSGGDGELFFFL